MFERKISLEETLGYAKAANDYAREQIKKGSTQLENNDLSEAAFNFLRIGVGETDITGTGTREIKRQQTENDQILENLIVATFENVIATSSKYSIGNCWEYACQALDYVLHNVTSEINAEVFSFANGDHTFLVLNRSTDENCLESKPETWGENAVICDPWANKCYKASDSLTELKNFYRASNKNYAEPFDPDHHIPIAMPGFNAHYLRLQRTLIKLKQKFFAESENLIQLLTFYKSELKIEIESLTKESGQNEKIRILSEKIALIDLTIRSNNDISADLLNEDYDNNYRVAKSELMRGLTRLTENAIFAIKFSNADRDKLYSHDPEHKQTKIVRGTMNLFKKTKTQTHLEEIANTLNTKLIRKKI